MTSPSNQFPAWAIGHAESELLARLRSCPPLFEDIARATGNEFQIQRQLRDRYDDELVRAALTQVELRQRGHGKFTRADEMWFNRVGLEQATSEPVAQYKAQRFSGRVWDLCCGIGGDALALAARADVIAVDLNPAMGLRTLWNAEAYGVGNRVTFECRDVNSIAPPADLLHIDPDRRPGAGGRVIRVEDAVPNLATLQKLMQGSAGGAIKLSPASNFGGKFPQAEVELISLSGECKEATIWYGDLAGTAPYRATVLPSGETLSGHPLDALAERSTIGSWIYDPDPAIVRAGLVDLLAEHLGLRRLDDAEEYLTGDHRVNSPFVQTFAVKDVLPNQEREIRRVFQKSDYGPLEIKCRHIPIQADQLRKRLSRHGDRSGVLIFVREQGKARAVVAERPGE